MEAQFPIDLDPEAILEDAKFKPSEMTLWEKFLEWDGIRSVASVSCAGISFLLLCICFGNTVSTRGSVAFGTALAGLCAVLFSAYGIGFGVMALKKRERQRAVGRAGLVWNIVCLAVFFGIYIVGV